MFPLRDSVPSRRFPFVNYLLIVANIYVFFIELHYDRIGQLDHFLNRHALIPTQFFQNPLAHLPNVFSAMFLHGGWGHLIGNMWFLHVFGDNIEDNVGHVRYVFYYLLMGFGAAAAQLAASPASSLPMIGASGAIAGVLGGYIILHPTARVDTLIFIIIFVRIIQVPAFIFLGLWFVTQTLNGLGSLSVQAARGDMGGVAWWAHAGGFAAGFIGIWIFRRR